MKSRKLSLRKESLAELSTGEMQSVAGGSGACFDTIVFSRCNCTGYYPSLNAPCDTIVTSVVGPTN